MKRRYKANIQIDYDDHIATSPARDWIATKLAAPSYEIIVSGIGDTPLEPVWISSNGDKHYPSDMPTPHIARALRCCHGNGIRPRRDRRDTPIYYALLDELIERNAI